MKTAERLRPTPVRAAAAALALLLAACAAPGSSLAPPSELASRDARAALDALTVDNHPAGAASKVEDALARNPADPWANLAAALLARRALDGPAEVKALAAAVAAAPDQALALVALRRLGELPEQSPELAREVEAAVAPLVARARLAGLAAFRARVARIAAAEALGELDQVARLRAENGALTAWTLAGPFGALHAFDFLRPLAPEQGTLPAEAPAPFLGAPRPSRPLATPDGVVQLEGEPNDGDAWYAASEVTLQRGGRYVAVAGTTGSIRLWIDGAPLLERRAFAGPAPGQVVRAIELPPGRHAVLAKLSRGGTRLSFVLTLVRADGGPSDAAVRPLPPGPLPAAAAGPWPAPGFTPAALAEALDPAGLAASRLLAARDAATGDLEAAKALLDEALARHPASAALLAARGAVHAQDATLEDQIGKGRAEAALRAALEGDPGDGEARLVLADLVRKADRPADAEALLAGLPEGPARRPAALAARARVALDRGLAEEAEALAEAARAAGGSCEALRLLADQAGRRDAKGREEVLVRALAACRGGRERLVRLLEQRGDPAGVLEVLAPAARQHPSAIQPALARANARAAAGDSAAAARELEPLLLTWPRHAPLLKAAADHLELAGDAAGARRLRERALLADPADLSLRRALALEDGHELLDDARVDGPAAVREYLAAPRREDAASAMVLDAAAVEFHPGGAVTTRVHQVIRVLDQESVNQLGEVPTPAGGQVLTLRTIKADGRILWPDGGDGKGAHSLHGLEPGDFVDVEYLVTARAAHARQGLAADPFFFATPGSSMFRSTYLVRAPHALGLSVDAHGMAAPPVVTEGGVDVLRVERTEVPALQPEPAAPPLTEFVPFVHAGVGGGREAVQLAMADGTVDRAAPTLELRALAAEVVKAAGPRFGPEALARAAYAAVRDKVQGSGGGLGDDASVVLSRGRGSRLVLLRAVLDLVGVPARFAAVRPPGGDQTDWRFPASGLWSQTLLRVPLPGGVAWLDPSVRQMPFGGLPERLRGGEALVLPAPGEAPMVDRVPRETDRPDLRRLEVRIALEAGGAAEVSGTDTYQGALAAFSKASLERLDERSRRQAVEQLLARSFRGIDVAEVAIEGEADPEAPLVIRWRGRVPSLARDAGGRLVVEAPLVQARLGPRWLQLAARTTPLLVDGSDRQEATLTVVPPPGAVAAAAPPEARRSPFGTFTRTEQVVDGALVRVDRLALERGRIAPADYAAFGAFAGGVDAVQARPVAFARSGDRSGAGVGLAPSVTVPGVRADPAPPSGK